MKRPAAGRDSGSLAGPWAMATSSVRANSHLKWFHVQDTESYVIGCDFLKFFIISGHCATVQCAKSTVSKRISQNIAVLLTKRTPFLKPTMFCVESWIMIVELLKLKLSFYIEIFTIEEFSHSMAIQNRWLRFARMNVFGLCMRLKVFLSGQSNQV